MKAKRKIKVLLLVEIALQDGVHPGFREDMGGPVIEGHGGAEQWNVEAIADELGDHLKGEFPKTLYPDHLWYVKNVKEATAP